VEVTPARPKAGFAPEPAKRGLGAEAKLPWSATGRVVDAAGQPMEGVEIWVHAGMGTLHRTGLAKTGADGRYTVEFVTGVLSGDPNCQMASITAHKSGFFEENLNRQGQGGMANHEMEAAVLKEYGIAPEALAIPGKPRTVDFVMRPAARIQGRLVGTGTFSKLSPEETRKNPKTIAGFTKLDRSPLHGWSVWLKGKEMPPGCSVICTAKTDEKGNFVMDDVPTGFEWQFLSETNRADTRDPLSPAFKLEKAEAASFALEMPEKQDALRIVAGK
jgi:hypothetical protein